MPRAQWAAEGINGRTQGMRKPAARLEPARPAQDEPGESGQEGSIAPPGIPRRRQVVRHRLGKVCAQLEPSPDTPRTCPPLCNMLMPCVPRVVGPMSYEGTEPSNGRNEDAASSLFQASHAPTLRSEGQRSARALAGAVMAALSSSAIPDSDLPICRVVLWRRIAKILAAVLSAWPAFSLKVAGPAANSQRTLHPVPVAIC